VLTVCRGTAGCSATTDPQAAPRAGAHPRRGRPPAAASRAGRGPPDVRDAAELVERLRATP